MNEASIIAQCVRFGRKIPDRIANGPELKPWLVIYLQAFFDLNGDRSQGFGPGRIPFTAILKYAEFYYFDREQTEDLIFYIKRMDDAHLKRLEKK